MCGDLGPISLSFSPRPVIPARIATVNGAGGTWRLYVIAQTQQRLDSASQQAFTAGAAVHFSGPLKHSELSSAPEFAAASRDGERLTVLDLKMSNASSDVGLEDGPAADFRSTRKVAKNCSGWTTGVGMPTIAFAALALLGLLRAWRRLELS